MVHWNNNRFCFTFLHRAMKLLRKMEWKTSFVWNTISRFPSLNLALLLLCIHHKSSIFLIVRFSSLLLLLSIVVVCMKRTSLLKENRAGVIIMMMMMTMMMRLRRVKTIPSHNNTLTLCLTLCLILGSFQHQSIIHFESALLIYYKLTKQFCTTFTIYYVFILCAISLALLNEIILMT